MKVVYLGAIDVARLSECFNFDKPLPKIGRRYPFGAELVIGLADAGHHVAVVVANSAAKEVEVCRSLECDVWMLPERLYRYQYPTLFYKELRLMRECLRQIKPDVCIANWTYQYARAAVTSGFPSVVIARDSAWRCLRWMKTWTMLFRSFYAQLFVFPFVKHLVTISPHMAEDLRRLNFYRGEITVIPNGIREGGDNLGKCGDRRKEIRREAKTIVCVTEWNKLKNSTTLMCAFVLLRKRYRDWTLKLVGNYMDERGALSWARKNHINVEGMDFLGLRTSPEIRKMLQEEADVFCSPTLEESFGQVFLEAMAEGVPCVGGRESGAVPWVRGDAGLLTDVKDPLVLANDIERLMLDYEKRKFLSERALGRVKGEFSIQRIINLYVKELQEVAAEEKRLS